MLKAGTLVRFRGSIGLVMGNVESRSADRWDVWVKWTDEPKERWERANLLEVLSESR